jgi:hypothetical protein
MATAVTLIVVAVTTKPYSTAVAARELRQIQDLRTNWSQKFIYDKLNRQHFSSPPFLNLGISLFDPNPNNARKTVYLRIERDDTIYEASFDESVCDYGSLGHTDIPTPPETVTRFGAWWDNLGRGVCYFYFPNRIRTPAVNRLGVKHTDIELLPSASPKAPPNASTQELKQLSTCCLRRPVEMFSSFDGGTNTLQYLSSIHESFGTVAVVLPVAEFERSEVSLNSVSSYMGIRPGRFDESFRDLEEVVKANGVESLAALQDILSKVAVSDSPVFEAFGIKFPADVATIGGTIVLLGVQLYFFIYLRKLSGTLKEDDDGWNVPWIGMDASPVARASSWTTIVFLPIASLLVLGTASAIRLTRGYWGFPNGKFHLAPVSGFHWTVDVKLVAMIVAIILSAYLGSICWEYRPQMAAVSAPPKPLEQVETSGKTDQPDPDPNKTQAADQN